VNNNASTNGVGVSFTYYSWYKDGVLIWSGTYDQQGGYYYTGGATLDPSAHYWVVLIGTDGLQYISCVFTPVIRLASGTISAYPTIVAASSNMPVHIEVNGSEEVGEATVEIFTNFGRLVETKRVTGRLNQITMPQVPGLYIVKYRCKLGSVVDQVKVIVTH